MIQTSHVEQLSDGEYTLIMQLGHMMPTFCMNFMNFCVRLLSLIFGMKFLLNASNDITRYNRYISASAMMSFW